MKNFLVPEKALDILIENSCYAFPDRSEGYTNWADTLETYEGLIKWEKQLKIDWWKSLDMNDPYLIKLFNSMFGSVEQRKEQIYIIRNTMNFKTR